MDTEAHELIAGYALDALDEADRARAKELLETSEEAREELRAFTDVAAGLATAATGPAPRPELRDRIVDAASAEGQNVVPVLAVGAALAACAAIAAGVWGLSVSSDLDDTRLALARERAAASILADPVTQSTLTGNTGRLVVGDEGRAVLVLSDAAPVPAGKSYQMWVIDDGQPVSAGLFRAGQGIVAVPVDGQVEQGSVVAVTIEDDEGATAPSGEPVIASAPVTLS